jgi:hypothetical protein
MTPDPYTLKRRLYPVEEPNAFDNNLRAHTGLKAVEQPFRCTGHAHLAGEHIRCTSPAHDRPPIASSVPTLISGTGEAHNVTGAGSGVLDLPVGSTSPPAPVTQLPQVALAWNEHEAGHPLGHQAGPGGKTARWCLVDGCTYRDVGGGSSSGTSR